MKATVEGLKGRLREVEATIRSFELPTIVNTMQLMLVEGVYLLTHHADVFTLIDGASGEEMDAAALVAKAVTIEPGFVHRMAAYTYLCQSGWTVASGTTYGADYVLYKISPEHYHALYTVRVTGPPGSGLPPPPSTWRHVAQLARINESVMKILVIAHAVLPADDPSLSEPKVTLTLLDRVALRVNE